MSRVKMEVMPDGKVKQLWFTKSEDAEFDRLAIDERRRDLAGQAAEIRRERDNRLAASDWTQLSDSQLSTTQVAHWAAYRQALRDVPEQAGFPTNVGWPSTPA